MQITKTQNMPVWAIGLMSGTSLDGIDAALLKTDGLAITQFGASHSQPYDAATREQIYALLPQPGQEPPSAQAIADAEKHLTQLHAQAVQTLLHKAGMQAADIAVIGFHGQTLWHRPDIGKTCQIGDGAMLARMLGIDVVNDFRSHDMSHGGQGAPLVPVFHQALLQHVPKPLAVLNIGGVANVTWIGESESELLAFDTGPGNALINDWVSQHTGHPYDENGALAAKGEVNRASLEAWLANDYFTQPPPKSLDRNRFKAYVSTTGDLSTLTHPVYGETPNLTPPVYGGGEGGALSTSAEASAIPGKSPPFNPPPQAGWELERSSPQERALRILPPPFTGGDQGGGCRQFPGPTINPPPAPPQAGGSKLVAPQTLPGSVANHAATLTELTARSVACAATWFPQPPKQWLVCGGGVHNQFLMQRLQHHLDAPVVAITQQGFDADMIEAQAFAYLAVRSLQGAALTFPKTTGVKEPKSGGVYHPASA